MIATPSLFLILMFPFVSAVLSLILRGWPAAQRVISLLLSFLFLIVSGALLYSVAQGEIFVEQAGGWPAPFGISLVADRLGAVMVFISGFVGFVVNLYSQTRPQRTWQGVDFHPLFHFLMAGVTGAFLTGDFFNLYVFFEILLMSSFAMMIQGHSAFQFEGTVKYVLLNLFASMVFLLGLAFLYNGLGTLNMADVGRSLQASSWSLSTTSGFICLFVAFAVKAGMFPLYFWLPSSYPFSPIATTALFAGLLTKVGVYALIRLHTMAGASMPESYLKLFIVLSLLTMIFGVLGAAIQMDIRKILSFHIISQIGYITLGLGYMTPLALAATVFYLIHHIVVKANLFLVAGILDRIYGTTDLKRMSGALRLSTGLAILFLIPALSLAGVPPFSGFWAKMMVLQAALEVKDYTAVTIACAVGLLTLYSMIKIWMEAFWRETHSEDLSVEAKSIEVVRGREKWILVSATSIFCLWTCAMGLGVGYAYDFAIDTGRELADSSIYIKAVLKERAQP